MKIERLLFTQPFTKDKLPLWHCPTCAKGILKADESDFTVEETIVSKNNYSSPDWDPSWINGSFIGKLSCSNSHCKEIIFVIGKMKVHEEETYNEHQGIWEFTQTEYLFPQIFRPTLHVFKIDDDIPENIKSAIENAFSLFWIDEGSCANKIRIVVELIMDERKVAKTYINKKKRYQYTLHKRIELFKASNPYAADCLMAIKWIGNSGSHANDQLTKEDLLDGLDILQHVTYKLYEKDTVRIKKLGEKIIKSKGPQKKR